MDTYMAPAILSVIAFLILFVWRFVFNGRQRRSAVREVGVPEQQDNRILEQGLHILERVGAVAGGNGANHAPDGAGSAVLKDRPKAYLLRIVALTGATQMGNGYDINVGTTKFHVRDRYVGRLRDCNNPKGAYEETCFYSAEKSMPKAEQIATALLQLKNNPALFDRWAAQNGAFKADGQAFSPSQ
jgi:hypothetical protein